MYAVCLVYKTLGGGGWGTLLQVLVDSVSRCRSADVIGCSLSIPSCNLRKVLESFLEKHVDCLVETCYLMRAVFFGPCPVGSRVEVLVQ